MTSLLRSLRRPSVESRYSLEDYIADVTSFYNGGVAASGLQETYEKNPKKVERHGSGFDDMVQGAYRSNGVVFACQLARLQVFTEARFQFQRIRSGRPADLFGTPALSVLERPWPNGATGDLMARMIQDVDTAGNSFNRRTMPTASIDALERLRPDWVLIVLGSNPDMITPVAIGYVYMPGGASSSADPIYLAREEVAHWAPIPDPVAAFRGMSWMTPIIREIRGDGAATDHKLAFWNNASTPNMVIKLDPTVKLEAFEKFKASMEINHRGVANSWKNLYLGGGADATVVGSNFKDMDLRAVQGAGETRIAAAAGVPPIIVGLSEGLDAATYSNYAQARRAFADKTMRHLWRTSCAALAPVIDVPNGARLWYDDRDIAFLQEDRKDAAEIQSTQAQTIAALVREGYKPDSVQKAVDAEDWSLLEHMGTVSVQQVPLGGVQPTTTDEGGPDA